MSTVQVAIPMLRGKGHFYIEKGRRWSVVEHLVLDAVAKRPATAAELAQKSRLPRRVAVEAFIRLMRVGWVELEPGEKGSVFTATHSGKAQLGAGELRSATRTDDRWMSFSIDRVAGNVFRRRELYVYPRSKVEKSPDCDALVYLDVSPRHAMEDLAAIYAALEGEDEVIVGKEPTPDRMIEGFAVVTVKDGEIDGLPARANDELRTAILARASESIPESAERKRIWQDSPIRVPFSRGKGVNAVFDQGDLMLGGAEHKAVLLKALNTARELVLVHSTFISADGWRQVLPAMIGAAARGATVQVLWGQADDQNETSASRLEAVAFRAEVAEKERSDQILVHPFSTGSHAKILVSDDGEGRWSAVVGSCNWLSSDFSSFEASVRIRDPELVGEVVSHIAMMSCAQDGIWHPEAGRLTVLGRRIASTPRGSGRTAKMRVLLAPDHSDLVLTARDSARARILVTSHRLGIAGKPMVIVPALAAAKAKNVNCTLYYCRATGALSNLDAAGITAELNRSGVIVQPVHQPRLHAKVLAWDDDALAVTSQNWLSADPSDSQLRREIGVFVQQNKLADAFIRRFEHAKSP